MNDQPSSPLTPPLRSDPPETGTPRGLSTRALVLWFAAIEAAVLIPLVIYLILHR